MKDDAGGILRACHCTGRTQENEWVGVFGDKIWVARCIKKGIGKVGGKGENQLFVKA